MKKQCLLVASIDDYHTCFSRRRPTDEQTSVNHPMCTIVIKKFPSIQAIPVRADANNPSGINPEKVANFITGFENIKMITKKTCASAMPSWIRERFFQPEMERNRLSAHEYSQSTDAQLLRQMNDLQLVDFLELPLKTQANYKEAIKLLTIQLPKNTLKSTIWSYLVITRHNFTPVKWFMKLFRVTIHGKQPPLLQMCQKLQIPRQIPR